MIERDNKIVTAFATLVSNFARWFKVKSVVTLAMTAVLLLWACGVSDPPAESMLNAYFTAYGVVLMSLFKKKGESDG